MPLVELLYLDEEKHTRCNCCISTTNLAEIVYCDQVLNVTESKKKCITCTVDIFQGNQFAVGNEKK